MNENGHVVFEIGYNQGEKLKSIVTTMYPNKNVEVIRDINGHQRIVSIKW